MLRSPTGKRKVLGAVHANVGIEIRYRRRLDAVIAAMSRAVAREIARAWREKPPEMAEDVSPAAWLRDVVGRLRRTWEDRFAELAMGAGKWVAKASQEHADRAFSAQLRKAGFTVKFQMTRAANDILQASIAENVSLIKSIPSQYFTQVESIVTEGVRIGRDMHVIAQGLEHQLGVTKRRAALIARDQSNKASASILRARQLEVGITEAVWLHSAGGRKPRPAHVAMNGKKYDVVKGAWDKDEGAWVHPGQLISCRCVSRAIVGE